MSLASAQFWVPSHGSETPIVEPAAKPPVGADDDELDDVADDVAVVDVSVAGAVVLAPPRPPPPPQPDIMVMPMTTAAPAASNFLVLMGFLSFVGVFPGFLVVNH